MKKYLIIPLSILFLYNIGICQPYIPRFKSVSQQEMMAVPMMMAQKAKETKNYLDNLTKDILSLRNETDDPVLDKYLSNAYDELSEFYDRDLANNQIISQINAKDRQIREALVEYNKQKKSKLDSNENNSNYSNNKIINSEGYYKLAVEKFNNNDFEGAYSDADKIINENPNFSQAYSLRGYLTLYYKKNPEIAIKDFTTAIQMNTNNKEIYFLRATCYEYLSKNLEAMLDYNNVLKIDNEHIKAYYRRGICKSNLGDRIGAIKDYDFILNYNGERKSEFKDMATVYNNKAFCLVELNKPKEGLPLVNEALKLDESLWYIWDTRAEIYYKIGEFQKCINDMDHAISIDEHDNSYYYRGLAKNKLGKKAEACSDLSKAGELGKSEAYEAIKKFCN